MTARGVRGLFRIGNTSGGFRPRQPAKRVGGVFRSQLLQVPVVPCVEHPAESGYRSVSTRVGLQRKDHGSFALDALTHLRNAGWQLIHAARYRRARSRCRTRPLRKHRRYDPLVTSCWSRFPGAAVHRILVGHGGKSCARSAERIRFGPPSTRAIRAPIRRPHRDDRTVGASLSTIRFRIAILLVRYHERGHAELEPASTRQRGRAVSRTPPPPSRNRSTASSSVEVFSE
jgi:hypothetical protein